ncbi:MAG: hypothetical protein KF834_03620 [Burkholderiales bacterium]|nr:hypothetical protein [Burkholderiales bacterium]
MKKISTAIALTLLTGCAAYKPIPEGYAGPVATVADSGSYEDGTKARIFAMTDVDGNRIMNSFWASANASHGRGFALTMVVSERQVPAKPMQVTLKGSHTTAAPIHAIASKMAGTYFSVEGTVNFEPKPNARYVVRGELKKEGSSVWIEDIQTGRAVTEKIVEKP